MEDHEFLKSVLKAFKDIFRETDKDSSESDVRHLFVSYFLQRTLGYEPGYIRWERNRADITILDENRFPVVKIETKRPDIDIDKPKHKEQAFSYKEPTTKYIGLTNFKIFKLWELNNDGEVLKLNINFADVLNNKKLTEGLIPYEKDILNLVYLTKEYLFDPSKYQKFNEHYAKIDITTNSGFNELLDKLKYIINDLLWGYTLRTFDEYKNNYLKYISELNNLNESIDDERILKLEKLKLKNKFKKYIPFNGYWIWKQYSALEKEPENEVKEIFCKESIYILINRILFIRISEDKGLLPQNISDGGIEFLRERIATNVYKEILTLSFNQAHHLYPHFYDLNILDWFITGNGELNEVLNRVLWILNRFDFAEVDRDILGYLYEKYLPKKERKRLGEFYTPTKIIDNILYSLDYNFDENIETKSIIDPSCGSGGFLVRATRVLIGRYLIKFGKTDINGIKIQKWKELFSLLSPGEAKIILEAIKSNIYGLDINPFACHIAEMNMLFQVIDLYQKVKEKFDDYELLQFNIYRTDSLEKPKKTDILDFYNQEEYLKEQSKIEDLKKTKFDLVVGNPPYVRQERISTKEKKDLKKYYKEIFGGRADLSIYFIKRGFDWLKDNGKLGYIVSGRFIQADYGKYLKAYLTSSTNIDTLIDLRAIKVFKDATNDPIILILSNSNSKESYLNMVRVLSEPVCDDNESKLELIINKIYDTIGTELKDEFLISYKVMQKDLIPSIEKDAKGREFIKSWNLNPKYVQDIKNKIIDSSTCLLSKICHNYRGIRTGAKPVFVLKKDVAENLVLEKELLKEMILGTSVKKWKIDYEDFIIIYLNKNYDVNLGDYVNIYNYLNGKKIELEKRVQFKNRRDGGENIKWYHIEQPLSPNLFEKPKIVTQRISSEYGFTVDYDEYYVLESCSTIVPKDNYSKFILYILGILNSKMMEFFCKYHFKALGKSSFEFEPTFLDDIPIKFPLTPEEFTMVDEITGLVNEILTKTKPFEIKILLKDIETDKITNYPDINFSLENNLNFEYIKTKDNKIFLSSTSYIEVNNINAKEFLMLYLNSVIDELEKSENIIDMVYNINIPKSDSDISNIIKKAKESRNASEEIAEIEIDINNSIYSLYDLKPEDIKTIEDEFDL